MTKTLKHRGPDGDDCWLGPGVGLGHTRLAIIDLAGGGQPLWDAGARRVIVFNGEIYNYRELRGELEAKGYTFRTRSDTEVIPSVIDAYGIDEGLLKLRGMFAFAMYDTATRRLLLARDRVGIKPLYWASTPNGIVFGSEQKALLASGQISNRIDPVAIHDYLGQGYPTTPSTCWLDMKMVEPGNWIEISQEGQRTGRYWHWRPRTNGWLNLESATNNTKTTLLNTLQYHLQSDVPLGVFLSGGIDSSLIVALLSDKLARGIQTFSMGFGDHAYDETAAARRVAEHCQTQHRESRMERNEADPDLFQQILAQYDGPFGDASCIPLYSMCGEISKHVKVVLSGDGGDEVLGGYKRYLYARRLSKLARLRAVFPLWRLASPVLESRFGRHGHRLGKAGRYAQMSRGEMLCALHAYISEAERESMYQPEFAHLALSEGQTSERFMRFIPEGIDDPIQQMIAAEMRLRLHANYLHKVDIASSAHGLEVRVPYLDNQMLEFAEQLPVNFKVANTGKGKVIARRLVQKLLTPEIAAKRKQGFDLPLDVWLDARTRAFIKDLLLDPKAGISSLLKRKAIERVWNAFADDSHNGQGLGREQRSQPVFLLAALELWMRRWPLGLQTFLSGLAFAGAVI